MAGKVKSLMYGFSIPSGYKEITMNTFTDDAGKSYVDSILADMKDNPCFPAGCHVEVFSEWMDGGFQGFGIIDSHDWDGCEHRYVVRMYNNAGILDDVKTFQLHRICFRGKAQRDYLASRIVENEQ